MALLMFVRFMISASVLALIGTIIEASAQSINMLIVCAFIHVRQFLANFPGHKLHQWSCCSRTAVFPH
jgi:hypothetical protein